MKRALILILALCGLILSVVIVYSTKRAAQDLSPDARGGAIDSTANSVALEADAAATTPARDLAPPLEKPAANTAASAEGAADAAGDEVRVEGKVLRPDGKPAALARVQYLQVYTNLPPGQAREDSAVTEEDGSFHIDTVPPGKIRFVAWHDDFAASEALFLDLVAREKRTGVTLTLRGYGRVQGFVRDAHNLAQPARTVTCSDQFSGKALFADSDNSGRFAFEKVTPGQHFVSVKLAEGELAQMNAEAPFLPKIIQGSDHQRWIDVKEGETVELVLGGVPAGGVRVFGRVSAAGRPVAHAWLWAVTLDNDADFLPLPHARTDEHGDYELWVRAAGRFDFQLSGGGGATDLTRRVTVPARAEQRLDFELSSASLSGRVVDRAGKPVAKQDVVLSYNGPLAGESSPTIEALSPYVVTGEDGAFSFQHLQSGRYSVSVSGGQEPNSDEGWAYGRVRTEEFTIETGATIEGLEIVLSPGCVLRGVVRGAPQGSSLSARVVVWDERGQRISAVRSDPDGSFVVRGLPEGELCAGANLGMQASQVSARVRLSASKEGFVELELGGGAMMNVYVGAAEGPAPLTYQLLVKDGRGNVVYDTYITHEDPSEPTWVQVLPVGSYTVDVSGADGSRGLATAAIEVGKVERVDVRVKRGK